MTDSQVEISAESRFAFGANWKSFVELVDEPRIAAARRSLIDALGVTDMTGQTFLDIGCGSGLFSLAAHQLGARVRSFDLDLDSVAATAELRRRHARDSGWLVEHGSIFDEQYVAALGCFDIVYSWGVLHHTGDLWRAVDVAARLVGPRGLLFVSVYNDQGFESRMWRRVKRCYNASGPVTRRILVAASSGYLRRQRPTRVIARLALRVAGRQAPQAPEGLERGMSVRHDLIDWVGGYPFEVAKPEDVFGCVRRLGFELRHLKTCAGGLGCNEYVFERIQGPLGCPRGKPEGSPSP